MWMSLASITLCLYLFLQWKGYHPYDTIKTSYYNIKLLWSFLKHYNIKTIINSGKQLMTYYIAQRFVKITKDTIEIQYPYGIQWYTIIFPRKRGPTPIKTILNDNKNITKEIRQYLGPSNNFHNIPTSPKMLGYSTLQFHYYNGSIKIFNDNDIITF